MDPNNIQEFIDTGVTVIENVFSDDEIDQIRSNFHQQLQQLGINHENVLSGIDAIDGGVRAHSRYANVFYNKWKLDAMLDPRVYELSKSLILNTFRYNNNPFEDFDDVLPFIDRVCYRLPDKIRAEGGLFMHLDRNPTNPYILDDNGVSQLKRWRPIQSFICLTDHYNAESGGLKVVKGFHHKFDEYFKNAKKDYGTGEFYRLHSKSHAALEQQLEFVYAPRGSVVYFDNRLPHATCEKLDGDDTREVIYFSYMPRVELNMNYWNKQKHTMISNVVPPMYRENDDLVDRNWNVEDLNELQRRLLGFT